MRCFIFIYIICLVGVGGQSFPTTLENRHEASHGDIVTFDNLFSPVRSIPIEGTKEHPVFQITDVAIQDSFVVVLDQSAATVTAFNLDGNFLYQVGRPGRGPGEFTNPYWIGFDLQGRILVLEGASNHRIQVLSPEDGRSLDVIANGLYVSRGSDNVFVEGEPGDQRLIFATQSFCGVNQESARERCVVHEYNLTSAQTVRRFARISEVAPEGSSMPWLLGRDENGYSYASSVTGPFIGVYGPDGAFERRFSIAQEGTNFQPLDYSTLPENPRAAVKEMARRGNSIIAGINIFGGDILVHHIYSGNDGADPVYFSVFSRNGEHKGTTTAVSEEKFRRVKVMEDKFFFVQSDSDSELGSYTINEYVYKKI